MNREQRRKAGQVKNNVPLEISMGLSGEQVVVNFSTMVHWIGMDLAHAEEFVANFQAEIDKLKVSVLDAKRNHNG